MKTKNKNKTKTKNKINNKASTMQSSFDTQGSWTGTYFLDEYEEPVQDVDDL